MINRNEKNNKIKNKVQMKIKPTTKTKAKQNKMKNKKMKYKQKEIKPVGKKGVFTNTLFKKTCSFHWFSGKCKNTRPCPAGAPHGAPRGLARPSAGS